MSSPFSLIVFDCDGTLVDTEPLQNMACAQLLAEEGLARYDTAYVHAHFVGVKFSVMLKQIAAQTGHVFPPDIGARYVARTRALADAHFKTVPGAKECVEQALERGVKICVGSNGQRDNVIDSLRRADLKQYFPDSHVFTAIEVENPKPAPDLFLLAAEKMGTDPAQCVVIEDSVPGARAGVAAGMRVIGFTGTADDKDAAAQALAAAGVKETWPSFIHIQAALFPAKPLK